MKKENQASKFDGTLDIRRHPIDPEHYGTVAKATAEALAAEIARRAELYHRLNPELVHHAAAGLLYDWFTGKWTPGGPTDPPDGAPDQTKNTGGGYDTTHERDQDLGSKLDRLLKE